ncbi:hypothetical protein [Rhodoferax sp. GW822-FHT02A01]|uniref:hypothetical protein n=1 Tax=Rhodoferax sp. GW822-FHT02A01 TaxID=3141537 RepID=UPI00315CACB1
MTKWTLPQKTKHSVVVKGNKVQLSGFNSADVLAAYEAGRREALEEAAQLCDALEKDYKKKREEIDSLEDSLYWGMSCGAFESAAEIRKLLARMPVDKPSPSDS